MQRDVTTNVTATAGCPFIEAAFEPFLSLSRHWLRQPPGRQSSLTGNG
jgi:hypothetical protein